MANLEIANSGDLFKAYRRQVSKLTRLRNAAEYEVTGTLRDMVIGINVQRSKVLRRPVSIVTFVRPLIPTFETNSYKGLGALELFSDVSRIRWNTGDSERNKAGGYFMFDRVTASRKTNASYPPQIVEDNTEIVAEKLQSIELAYHISFLQQIRQGNRIIYSTNPDENGKTVRQITEERKKRRLDTLGIPPFI